MKNWPLNAYVVLILLVILSVVAVAYTYKRTRASYLQVGYNNGQSDARIQVISKLESLVKLEACQMDAAGRGQLIELISVKADSVYARPGSASSEVKLCRAN
jgi:Tfp pilus assembly protein PilO